MISVVRVRRHPRGADGEHGPQGRPVARVPRRGRDRADPRCSNQQRSRPPVSRASSAVSWSHNLTAAATWASVTTSPHSQCASTTHRTPGASHRATAANVPREHRTRTAWPAPPSLGSPARRTAGCSPAPTDCAPSPSPPFHRYRRTASLETPRNLDRARAPPAAPLARSPGCADPPSASTRAASLPCSPLFSH